MTRFIATGCAVVACVLAAFPAAGQGLDPQLLEIRTLIREKRYPLALESLRLVARQIQDLRMEAIVPAFPAPPSGWTAQPALSLLEEGEIWSNRITAERSYVAAPGPARVDVTIDLNTPLGPATARAFNPLLLTGDARSRIVPVGQEQALLRYNPDTGEGELRVLVGRETLVTAHGHGIPDGNVLVNFARGVDYPLLRRASGR